MNKKIKVAAIKFAGCSHGGSERFIQTILANLSKNKFEVDFYYTNAAPYVNNDYKHIDNDPLRMQYMKDNGVNLIPIHVDFKDITQPHHPWLGTDLYQYFDQTKYDVITTVRAGHKEFPICDILGTPVVEIVTLPNMADRQDNIITTIHISEYQKNTWIAAGGDPKKAVVFPIISELPTKTGNDLRTELGIPKDAFVFGMHQRSDNGIYASFGLEAYKKIMNKNTWFVIMGGGDLYTKYAKENNLINFIHLAHSGDPVLLDKFLNTLNIFSGMRHDGETFGNCLVEAMSYSLPILHHQGPGMALGHIETIGNAGFICSTVDEYANYMIRLMNDIELRSNLGKKAIKKYYEDYSIPKVMEKITKIYENAANTKLKSEMTDEEFWDNI